MCQLELFFCFFRKKEKKHEKRGKNLPEYPPRLADVPGDFSKKWKKRKENIGLALANLDENSFKFETGIKNKTR